MSIGSGGLEGTGIGSGWQKLSYLPEANTDFVIDVIGEELGLIGTLAVCFFWMAVFVLARFARNPTSLRCITGIAAVSGASQRSGSPT